MDRELYLFQPFSLNIMSCSMGENKMPYGNILSKAISQCLSFNPFMPQDKLERDFLFAYLYF